MAAPLRPSRAPRAARSALWSQVQDVVALGKPRLSLLVLVTTAGGLYLAPGKLAWWQSVLTLVMTMLAVGSANTLNCYLERDSDKLMKRTRSRPLPSGRLSPQVALWAGVLEGAVSVPVLTWAVNPLSGMLALVAIVSYVAIYTPMKQRSAWAVVVGAIPGAIPPLLGYAAVTGSIDLAGSALFGVLFLWQLPHFLAIALYLREDYGRAGIRVVPLTHGDGATRVGIAVTSALLLPMTLVLVPLHLAGVRYAAAAALLGLGLFAWSVTGLRKEGVGARWARGMMLASVGYLSLLFAALALDAA